MKTTTTADPVDWVELELAQILDRYGWKSVLSGLARLLPLGETLGGLIETIKDQKVADLTEQSQYTEQHDRAGYRSNCF